MRLFSSVTLLPGAIALLCCASLVHSAEYDEEDEPRLSYLSRRAIDGTRGRKYFNPKEDGFFDDYGFERGQYHADREQSGLSDLRNNVPGEPGVDYPAFEKIPRTSFSCIGRERGYYADEESGCQSFHVCDEGLVSSFLCPVGSLFSQRLLTCDWWSKVPCSQSHEFYNHQYHAEDVSLTDADMLRQALTENTNYRKPPAVEHNEPTLVNVRKHENQLEHGNDFKNKGFLRNHQHRHRYHEEDKEPSIVKVKPLEDADSPIIKIKPLDNEGRRSRVRGHTRSGLSDQGQRRHPYQEASSEPSVTTATAATVDSHSTATSPEEDNRRHGSTISTTVAEEFHTHPTFPKDGIHDTSTTSAPYEATSQLYQDNTSDGIPTDIPTKKGLEEDNGEPTNPPVLSNHNSAEYDDMEGKESIGLANSHVERNLDIHEEKTTTIDIKEATAVKSFENTTPVTFEQVDQTTQQEENIEAKESVGFVHSKVEEKLQLYDNEKKVKQNSAEQKNEGTPIPIEEQTTATTLIDQSESSTLPCNKSSAAEELSSYTHPVNENTEVTKAPRTEVRKMSGFRINIAEKRVTTASPVTDEISSSDYQELLNSSDSLLTSTVSTDTTANLEEQTTIISNNVRRISDAVEESNTPFEVTLTVNGSSNLLKDQDQSPIGADVLSQLISQHENQPIDLTDLEIVKSDMTNRDFPLNNNQQQASSPAPSTRIYQNIRDHEDQQTESQNYMNHRPQPAITTTFGSYRPLHESFIPTSTQAPSHNFNNYQNHQDEPKNFNDYQSHQEQQTTKNYQSVVTSTPLSTSIYKNFQDHRDEPRGFKNYKPDSLSHSKHQQFISTTTQAPELNYRNYQNSDIVSRGNRRYQAIHEDSRNFRNPKTQNFDTTTSRNFRTDQEELNDYNHQHKPSEPINFIPTTVRSNFVAQEEPLSVKNYQHRPERPSDFVSTTIRNLVKTQEEPLNIKNNLNQQEEPNNFGSTSLRRFLENEEEPLKLINYQNQPKESTNFVSTTIRNILENQEEHLNVRNHQNQQETENNFKTFQNRQKVFNNFNNYQNQPATSNNLKIHNQPIASKSFDYFSNEQNKTDFRNYHVNYQTHHYPENVADYQPNERQKNENYNTQINGNNQNSRNSQNYRFQQNTQQSQNVYSDQNTENPLNYQNQDTGNFEISRNQHNRNHPDYQNYDSAEDLVENTQFGDFGARLSSKNRNSNTVRIGLQKPKVTESTDAYSINSGLQGKAANFLYAMSQLAKTDRYPRPFAQDKNNFEQTSNSRNNGNRNSFTGSYNKNKNNENGFSNFKQIPNRNLNYNKNNNANYPQSYDEDQPYVDVDDFAAPRLVPVNKNLRNHNVFLSQRNEKFNKVQSTFEPRKQQNFSQPREERILNHAVPSTTETPIQFLPQFNTYNGQNTPEVNKVRFDNNQQFVSTSQPGFNEYNIENSRVPTESAHTSNHPESQPINYNFQHSTQQTFSSSPQDFNTYQTQSDDFVPPQPTQQSYESTRLPSGDSQVYSTLQSHTNDFVSQQPSQQPIENTHFSSNSPHLLSSIQPHTVDYNSEQPTQETFENTRPFNNGPHISSTIQPHTVDYNSEQPTQETFQNTRPFNNGPHILSTIQPHTVNYNSQEPTQETFQNTGPSSNGPHILSTIQSHTVDYNSQEPTQETFKNTQPSSTQSQVFSTNQPHSLDYDFQANFQPQSQQTVEDVHLSSKTPQTSNTAQSESVDYDFRPTVLPPSKSDEHKLVNFNASKMVSTSKTTVETEFIPSLSFDFGSDQGRKEYLEALEKGLVPNDDRARNANGDITSSASANVEKAEEESVSGKDEKSAVMDNFKDTKDVMSEAD